MVAADLPVEEREHRAESMSAGYRQCARMAPDIHSGRAAGCGRVITMLDDAAVSRVAEIIREVSATEILPRFGRLEDGEIVEKGPGDLVTVADRASERELTARLRDLLPGSRVVGEEAVFEDPGVLDALDGPDPVWIIDPIDGTDNYANANARFTVLVALARGGELQASWNLRALLRPDGPRGQGRRRVPGRRAAASRPRSGPRHRPDGRGRVHLPPEVLGRARPRGPSAPEHPRRVALTTATAPASNT